jgi:hypothetical protein
VCWFDNEGNETFTMDTLISDIFQPQSINTTDLDRDGDTDIIITSPSDTKIYWYENLLITSIDNHDYNYFPRSFELRQNYPNPFNPVTNIEFTLPKSNNVVLTVYNVLGEEISQIVSQNLSPGTYKYQYDGSQLTSGIYYYQIVAGKYREVKKMVVIK